MCICFIILGVSTFIYFDLKGESSQVALNNTNINDNEYDANLNTENDVNIYDDEKIDELLDVDINTVPEPLEEKTNVVTMTVLGEMMMGGAVTKNLSYNYNLAFSDIYAYTRDADFTYATFPTSITTLNEIVSAKSNYIVTKDILNALSGLGVDVVTLASDHMTDFTKNIFNSTISTLGEYDFTVAGLYDNIVYMQENDKKIAIISSTSAYLNSKSEYEDFNINIYDEDKIKRDIETAKENADFVIVDFHFGKESEDVVTTEMQKMAKHAVDCGADLILGSHSLGAKPVTMYKDTPIIYSVGYLITDAERDESKESYIYNITIDENNKVEEIEMIPIYIADKKATVMYADYDYEACKKYNEENLSVMLKNDIEAKILNDKIIVTPSYE